MLVRSTFTEWAKGSVIAVDAGAHLASITRILEEQLPKSSEKLPPKGHVTALKKGPFAGIKLPNISAGANALHMFRELVHSFLITHPHLDHIAGLGVNTPALEYGREAKAIVALPSTIDAIKTHIFNDIIWPNLSDENEGVGFVTYRRLIEGGNPRLGSGDGRGYVSVCNGVLTKCWTVSHGRCKRPMHQHSGSIGFPGDGFSFPPRRASRQSEDNVYLAAIAAQQQDLSGQNSQRIPGTPGNDPNFQPVDSSAFFLRNETDGTEIIVFGDVEPDSVSLSPRNHIVWEDAAGKVASGTLKAIFIECSYDDSVRDQELYGHLCPRHLIAELRYLAAKVLAVKKSTSIAIPEPGSPSLVSSTSKNQRKRKRTVDMNGDPDTAPPSPIRSEYVGRSKSRGRVKSASRTSASAPPPHQQSPSEAQDQTDEITNPASTRVYRKPSQPGVKLPSPLTGLKVFIIHVKDTLMDGPSPKDIILRELQEQGEEAGLGCTFEVTKCGADYWI